MHLATLLAAAVSNKKINGIVRTSLSISIYQVRTSATLPTKKRTIYNYITFYHFEFVFFVLCSCQLQFNKKEGVPTVPFFWPQNWFKGKSKPETPIFACFYKFFSPWFCGWNPWFLPSKYLSSPSSYVFSFLNNQNIGFCHQTVCFSLPSNYFF